MDCGLTDHRDLYWRLGFEGQPFNSTLPVYIQFIFCLQVRSHGSAGVYYHFMHAVHVKYFSTLTRNITHVDKVISTTIAVVRPLPKLSTLAMLSALNKPHPLM